MRIGASASPAAQHGCCAALYRSRRLLGVCGGKVVYVESIARVYRLSLSGTAGWYRSTAHLLLASLHVVGQGLLLLLCWAGAHTRRWYPVLCRLPLAPTPWAASPCLCLCLCAGKILYHARLAHTFFVQVSLSPAVSQAAGAQSHAAACLMRQGHAAAHLMHPGRAAPVC